MIEAVAYMHQLTESTWVQVMASYYTGDMQVHASIVNYSQMDLSDKQIRLKIKST